MQTLIKYLLPDCLENENITFDPNREYTCTEWLTIGVRQHKQAALMFFAGLCVGFLFLLESIFNAALAKHTNEALDEAEFLVPLCVLLIAGSYFASKKKELWAFKQLIQLIKRREVLNEHNVNLDIEKAELKKNNLQAKAEVQEIDSTVKKFTSSIKDLDVLSNEISENNAELELEIQYLEKSLETHADEIIKLSKADKNLQKENEILSESIGAWRKFDESIKKHGVEKDMHAINNKLDHMMNYVRQNVTEVGALFLDTLATQTSLKDDNETMTKQEWDEFHKRLPPTFKKIFEKNGYTFDSVAGNDGVIDFDEITDFIDTVSTNAFAPLAKARNSLKSEKDLPKIDVIIQS